MSAQKGSAMVVSFKDDAGSPAYQVIAGLRTRQIQLNSEQVDITNSDSVGLWRELLDAHGVRTATLSGDGVFQDDAGMEAVRDAVFENELRDAKILIPSFGIIEGKFKVSTLGFAGEYNRETTYTFTFESAGEIIFTAV